MRSRTIRNPHNIWTIAEADAKILSRAIELMFLVKDIDTVILMLSLETGESDTAMVGYARIADSFYKDPASVDFGKWERA